MKLIKLLPISMLAISLSSHAEVSRTHTQSNATYANQHELTKISSRHKAVVVNNDTKRHTYHVKFKICANKCLSAHHKVKLDPGKSKRIEQWVVLLTKYDEAGHFETVSYSEIQEQPEAYTSDKGYIDVYGHY